MQLRKTSASDVLIFRFNHPNSQLALEIACPLELGEALLCAGGGDDVDDIETDSLRQRPKKLRREAQEE